MRCDSKSRGKKSSANRSRDRSRSKKMQNSGSKSSYLNSFKTCFQPPMRFTSTNPNDSASKKYRQLQASNGKFKTFSQDYSPSRLDVHFTSVALPDKPLARNCSLTSLTSGIPKPTTPGMKRNQRQLGHSRSVCEPPVAEVELSQNNTICIEDQRSKSKERPLIPKLNLDYSYLEQKCIEREIMERQITAQIDNEIHQEDLVESSQFVIIDENPHNQAN